MSDLLVERWPDLGSIFQGGLSPEGNVVYEKYRRIQLGNLMSNVRPRKFAEMNVSEVCCKRRVEWDFQPS